MTFKRKLQYLLWMMTLALLAVPAIAQNTRVVTGIVLDSLKTPVEGATVQVKSTKVSTKTAGDGRFTINVPTGNAILVITNIGKQAQEINVSNQSSVQVSMKDVSAGLDNIVVVGYGRQRKESVVGAISQTSGKDLQRAGGVSTIGGALTGNVPGVTTIQGTGQPGGEDPTIYIRGTSTTNNSAPLILVDGIERQLSGVDIGSVEVYQY